jgi:hypothetical protein
MRRGCVEDVQARRARKSCPLDSQCSTACMDGQRVSGGARLYRAVCNTSQTWILVYAHDVEHQRILCVKVRLYWHPVSSSGQIAEWQWPSATDGVEMRAPPWRTNEMFVMAQDGVRIIRTQNALPGCDSCCAHAARANHPSARALLARMERPHLDVSQSQDRLPRLASYPAPHRPAC